MNFLSGARAAAFGATTIGFRPEHLRLDASGELRGVVRTVEHLGNEALVHVQLEDDTMITARCTEDTALHPGAPIAFTPDPASIHRFDQDNRALDVG
ncbi:MAG: TOBE domain-containing protein [Hyphomonadaceae bacterium JAD_PAG50586_4]|nr:MAG: TOBE domain-containing protein [Hyphomonadaceae bacterium JAD_PAG50586_4]